MRNFMRNFILNHTKWFYFTLFILLSFITCFLQPHDDDWQYLYYFDEAEQWGFTKYEYVMDCIFLPGSYWRPLWSIFNRMEALYWPTSMPYANHIFISFGMVGISYIVYILSVLLKCKKTTSIIISIVLIMCTTSMGALLSIDSFQNVYATFFGLLSVLVYIYNKGWKRWLLWFLIGWLAAMSKETGFVWFVAGPIFDELLKQKTSGKPFNFNQVNYKQFIPKLFISIFPIVLYLVLYITLKPEMLDRVGFSSEIVATNELSAKADINNKSMFTTITEMEEHNSYKLTPSTFVKNIAVLYIFGLLPIDTSAIYFKDYTTLGLTSILAIIWFAIFLPLIYSYFKKYYHEAILLLLLAVWISGPSLITRAGEISPIVHMSIIAILITLVFNNTIITKQIKIGVIFFLTATIVTDIHKYYLAFKIGNITREIAQKVVKDTEGFPENVLMVQVDDFSKKKSGAFMINPADGIRKGAAMIREYSYKYPKKLQYLSIPDDENIKITIDSIVNHGYGIYDCIWFCHDTETKVYNLKKK